MSPKTTPTPSMSKYMDLYLAESREHLSAVEEVLARLEAAPGDEPAKDDLFRHAHSLKGMSASMGFRAVSEVAHGIEDAIYALKRDGVAFDAAMRTEMAAAFDLVDRMIFVSGSDDSSDDEPAARLAALRRLLPPVALPSRSESADPAPRAAAGAGGPMARSRMRIDLVFSPDAPLAAARAAVALRRFGAMGTLVGSTPTFEDLGRKPFDRRLSLMLDTPAQADDLRALMRSIVDLESGSVTREASVGEGAPSRDTSGPGDDPGRERTAPSRAATPVGVSESAPEGVTLYRPPSLSSLSQPSPSADADLASPMESAEPAPGAEASPLALDELAPPVSACTPISGRAQAGTVGRDSRATLPPGGASAGARDSFSGGITAAPPGGVPPGIVDPDRASAASATVRIPSRSLDQFLDTIGELIVQRGRLTRLLEGQTERALEISLDRLKGLIDRLYSDVMALRLIPFDSIAHRFVRSVRELAGAQNKHVLVRISGREILLDRSMLDELYDPINHILRNAIDHGIETPAERVAAGKLETGAIGISLERGGDSVVIRVEDDGRGMNPDHVRRAALEKGFITQETYASIDDANALMLTTIPGFSTTNTVTQISGRGVGMDIVRTRVETLGGRLSLRSRPGSGLIVEMRLPLTIVVVQAFVVEAGGQVWAVPISSVERTFEVRPEIVDREGPEISVAVGDGWAALFDLAETLGLSREDDPYARIRQALLASHQGRSVAFAVDKILGRREIVVKPLRQPLEELRGYSGATILDDGRIALILDLLGLARI